MLQKQAKSNLSSSTGIMEKDQDILDLINAKLNHLKKDQSTFGLVFAPTYYPSEEEFKDPMKFIGKIRHEAELYGICKIVPPKSWNPPFSLDLEKFKFKTRKQQINEMDGKTRASMNFTDGLIKFHEQSNSRIAVAPTINQIPVDLYALKKEVDKLFGFATVSDKHEWPLVAQQLGFGPTCGEFLKKVYVKLVLPYEVFLERKALGNKGPKVGGAIANLFAYDSALKKSTCKRPRLRTNSTSNPSGQKSKLDENPAQPSADPCDEIVNNLLSTLIAAGIDNRKGKVSNFKSGLNCEICFHVLFKEDLNCVCVTCGKGFHGKCLVPQVKVFKKDWFCPQCLNVRDDYSFEEGNEYNLVQFKDKANEFKLKHFKSLDVPEVEVEKEFWKLAKDPYSNVEVEYGADLHSSISGSGFPDKLSFNKYAEHPWNLNNIPNQPESLLRFAERNIDGMIVPWLYVGMCFSTFCWHTEDHYTYSVNYLHWGDTKTWYGVASSSADQFEKVMKDECPELFEAQPDLLFHITTMLSPLKLIKAGVKVCTAHQRKGEFVVTFPQSYHAGFNQGLNFAEAVNFALPDWIPYGISCGERYRIFNKLPVFSVEQLVFYMLSANPVMFKSGVATRKQKTETSILRIISELSSKEIEQRYHLQNSIPNLNIVPITESIPIEVEHLLKDSLKCCNCSSFCFLSFVTSHSQNDKENIYCLSEDNIPKCFKVTMWYLFTSEELIEFAKGNFENFAKAVTRVQRVFSLNKTKSISSFISTGRMTPVVDKKVKMISMSSDELSKMTRMSGKRNLNEVLVPPTPK